MPRARRFVQGSIAAVLAVGLGGCASLAEGTQTTAAVTVENFAEVVASGQAELDPVSCTFEMVVSMSGTSLTGSGGMRVQADGTPAMSMSMTVPEAGAVELRLVGGLMYMNLGEQSGGKWVSFDPADASLGLPEMPAIDPAGDAAGLADALVSVTEVGAPETLDGVEVRQYEVVVDPAKLTGALREQLDQGLAAAAQDGAEVPAQLTYRYWLGADGLPRKTSTELAGVWTEMTFSGWGEPVEIAAPAPEDVVEFSQMAELPQL